MSDGDIIECHTIDNPLVDWHKLERVADSAQLPRIQVGIHPLEVDVNEFSNERCAIFNTTLHNLHVHLLIFLGRAKAVDSGDRSDNNDIFSYEQGLCRGVTQAINLGINHRLLLDIRVRVRDVCLRLIVIIVRNKIMHCVLGEELSILLCELGRECFIVRENKRRLIIFRDNICHRKRLPASSDTEERLMPHSRRKSFFKFLNRLRLIPRWHPWRVEFEVSHDNSCVQSLHDIRRIVHQGLPHARQQRDSR